MDSISQRRGPQVAIASLLAGTALMAGATSALADKGGQPNGGQGRPRAEAQSQSQPASQQQPAAEQPENQPQPAAEPKRSGDDSRKDDARHDEARPAPSPTQRDHGQDTERPAPVPAAAQQRNPHADAGKITICHATASATNPYVQITISRNALPAHQRHEDGRDIIPAPAGGCPRPAVAPSTPSQSAPAPEKPAKVTICHATGSATNPYVQITISTNAVPAHQRHQDGRDIIPAPAAGCPAPASAVQGDVSAPGEAPAPTGSTPVVAQPAPAPAAAPVIAAAPSLLPRTPLGALPATVRTAPSRRGTAAKRGSAVAPGVAGEVLGIEEATAPTAAVAATRLAAGPARDRLPFTGFAAALVAFAGSALLLGGFVLRRVDGGTRA